MKRIIVILAIAVGVVALALFLTKDRDGVPQPPTCGTSRVETPIIIDGTTNTIVESVSIVRSVERRPLEPEATKRLHDGPVVISSLFEASGTGEYANYGKAYRGSYLYTTTVLANSQVMNKQEDEDTGMIRVVERRRFLQARDHIVLSEVDVALALDTLPVDQVRTWVDNACTFVAGACAIVTKVVPITAPFTAIVGGGAVAVKSATAAAFNALYKVDRIGARALVESLGVKIPDNLDAYISKKFSDWAETNLLPFHTALQPIEGKSFLITYLQSTNGAPLKIDYANEDGSPISDAEWEILRSANVFLDSNVVPDTRCSVGDTWTVWADEVQELFGCAGDGRVEGKIRVERVEDQKDGTWTLKVEPATVEFRSTDGTAAGKMQIKDGNGLVDAENASVKTLHATADGNLRSLNKKRHFMFFDFVKRLDGDSNLRFTLTAEPAKSAQSAK